MHFSIFDENVSTTMNVFLVIGNIINLIYNIPQMVKTYKSKSTGDFSPTFLFMRVAGNVIWLAYSIELNEFLFIFSNVVSVFSSVFISYYKLAELLDYNKDTLLMDDENYQTYADIDDPCYNGENDRFKNDGIDDISVIEV
jgi:uncharacterized protein with PQ loop repeat